MKRQLVRAIVVGLLLLSGCQKKQSTNDLLIGLKSSSDADRIKSVRQLQHRRGDAATVIPALIESLKDHHADIRWSAVIGLGYFGEQAQSALPDLERIRKDPDGRVRNAVQVAIARIQQPAK